MHIGEKIRKIRELKGLNQKQLSEKTGITQATISRIENEKVITPKLEAVRALASVLGITLESLTSSTNEIVVEKTELIEFDRGDPPYLKIKSEPVISKRRTIFKITDNGIERLPMKYDKELIELYSRLSDESQNEAKNYISYLVEKEIAGRYKKNIDKTDKSKKGKK